MEQISNYKLEKFQEGFLFLVDKPLNWSSFQAVNAIKWSLKKKFNIKKIKIGHAGTLDPLASGLLLICCGKMTKQIADFQKKGAGKGGHERDDNRSDNRSERDNRDRDRDRDRERDRDRDRDHDSS